MSPTHEEDLAELRRANAILQDERDSALARAFALDAELAARKVAFAEQIDHQAATIDVLKAMSDSPGDPRPVFDQIVARARELCNGRTVTLHEFDGELIHLRAIQAPGASSVDEFSRSDAGKAHASMWPSPPTRETTIGRAILDRTRIHIRDMRSDPDLAPLIRGQASRSQFTIPLMLDNAVIGTIGLSGADAGGFSDRQVALLETFAEQAVIAIRSAETFRALEARTAELASRNTAFAEQIDHQAATIDVLKAMSAAPGDPQPVFDLIVRRARDLYNATNAGIFGFDGEQATFLAAVTPFDEAAFAAYIRAFPMLPRPGSLLGRAVLDREIAHVRGDGDCSQLTDSARQLGVHSGVVLPLLSDGKVIGAISIGKQEVGGFSISVSLRLGPPSRIGRLCGREIL